jgi:hypothetical protein
MIRKAASKFLILAAATLASGAIAVNCSKKADKDDVGSVGLALVLPGGGIVNSVSYTISGNGITPIMGTIDVSAPGTTTATALVSGLPEGMYTVSMSAMGTNPDQTCAGTAPFTVVRNTTASAMVILQCTRINNRGSVALNGRLDQCPLITALSASSLQGVVGGAPIMLGVVASELDPGDTVTYSWTATTAGVGSIGAQAANTTFTCLTAGSTIVGIAVSDGICGDSIGPAVGPPVAGVPITCVGTGTAGTTGSAGTTGTAGTTGSAGTTGTAGTTGSAGTTGTAGTTGSAGTTGTAGTTGSAGTTGTAGTTGSAGTGGSAPDFSMCPFETNPPAAIAVACQACLDANKNPATDGCCGIVGDPTGLQLCQAASACMRAGGPPVGQCNIGGDVTTCYCGSNLSTCSTGGANGPCLAQIAAAAGRNVMTMTTDAPNPATILSRQGDPAYAIGRAANIAVTAAAFCPADCGF